MSLGGWPRPGFGVFTLCDTGGNIESATRCSRRQIGYVTLMTALLATIASIHPGLHAHPHGHDESLVHTLIASPWAAALAGAALLAVGLLAVRRRQRD